MQGTTDEAAIGAESSAKQSLIIASRSRMWQEGLSAILRKSHGIEVAALCKDLSSLVLLTRLHRPQLVLVRLPLDGLDQLDDLLELRRIQPEVGLVVFLPGTSSTAAMQSLAHATGVSFLSTETSPAELAIALQLTAWGWVSASPRWAKRLFADDGLRAGRTESSGTGPLTKRQCIILEFLARGLSEKFVAETMGVSTRTVQSHIAAARERLGASSRTHAVTLAIASGIIAEPPLVSPRSPRQRAGTD